MVKIEKSDDWYGYCYGDIRTMSEEKMLELGLGDLITGYAHSDELKMYYIVRDGYFTYSGWEPRGEHYINCHSNEDMFMALAALRHSTDIHQWFVSDAGEWKKSETDKFDNETGIWHKATEAEIINHFND